VTRTVDREKRRADLRVRLKLFIANTTTYAYAITGASFIEPYIKGAGFKTASYVGIAVALVLHLTAWYAAPHGEKP
jgi:hypothetical protein